MKDTGQKTIAKNRRALHDYEVLETFEAGLELTGTEVRSLRENNCQLTDCFALIRDGELWLNNVHIAPYVNGTYHNPDPDRRPQAADAQEADSLPAREGEGEGPGHRAFAHVLQRPGPGEGGSGAGAG